VSLKTSLWANGNGLPIFSEKRNSENELFPLITTGDVVMCKCRIMEMYGIM
jgi:hypothetical protein